jgi:hypothetical protein
MPGFTYNSNPASMTCTGNCAAWGNGTATKKIGGVGTSTPGGATADKMINAKRNADGLLPDITSPQRRGARLAHRGVVLTRSDSPRRSRW